MKNLDSLLDNLIRPPRDLVVSVGISFLFLIAYQFVPDWVGIRVLLGLPLLFIIPGLLFVEIINLPIDLGNRALRLAMCFAFSILLVSGLAFFLSLFHNFYQNYFIISISFLIWLETGLLFFVRDVRGRDSFSTSVFYLGKPHKGDAMLVIGSTLILIFTAVILALYVPEEKPVGTNFYLLGPSGDASDYPTHLSPEQEGMVTVVVVCGENERTNYNVSIWLEADEIPPVLLDDHFFSLTPSESEDFPFSFTLSNYGLFRFVFQLRADEVLLEELYLWVEVSETIINASLPGTTGTAESRDPAILSINTTYSLAINITSHELNITPYQIAISLSNGSTSLRENMVKQWFDQNRTYRLDWKSLLFANETLAPHQSSRINLSFYLTEPGTYSIFVRCNFKEWPYESRSEKFLWVQVD